MMASRYKLLCDMARLLNRETDIRQLADTVIEKMTGILDFSRCNVAIVNPDGRSYSLRSQFEKREAVPRAELASVPLERGVAGRAIRRERITYLPDVQTADNPVAVADGAMEGGSLRSVLSVPLFTTGGAVGALTIGAVRRNAYSTSDVRMARQVAEVFALAIEREHGRELAQQLDRRLTSKRQELNETTERLEAATLELDAFIYAASHDLRAPLLSIAGLTDLARLSLKDGDTDGLEDFLERIQRNVKRLDQVVVDILQISRARRLERQIEPVDVTALISEVIETLWAMDDASNVDIRIAVTVDGRVPLERRRVGQILSNLLSNAIKYRNREEREPFVEVGASLDGADIVFRVVDNGSGIAADQRTRIFELFYRGSKHSFGSGLGLYIVKQHAQAMGGSVKLAPDTDVTVFEVRLPVSAP